MHANRIMVLSAITAALGATALTQSAQADNFFDPPLPGTTATDYWPNFTPYVNTAGYGGNFPGSAAWTQSMPAITSTQAPSDVAEFIKVSGNGFTSFTGDSSSPRFIYMPTFAPNPNPAVVTTYRLFDQDAIAGLKTVVFQVNSQPGDTSTTDFSPTGSPVLNYNGGTQALAPVGSGIHWETGDVRDRYFQWDLSSIAGPINDFEIRFNMITFHTGLYSLQVDQGTTFAAVPEPATGALLAAGVAAPLLLARRRRRTV